MRDVGEDTCILVHHSAVLHGQYPCHVIAMHVIQSTCHMKATALPHVSCSRSDAFSVQFSHQFRKVSQRQVVIGAASPRSSPQGVTKQHPAPFSIRSTAAVAAASIQHDLCIPTGHVTITPLCEADVQGAALLLTRAFAGTAEAVKLNEAVKYMEERLLRAAARTGLTLVAQLVPTDAALLPPGKASRLVGTVSLSFTASSREVFKSLAPPEQDAYLANMAVDPKFRRQGIARAMLAACDEAVLNNGQQCIWLHVRQSDSAAQQLYSGYAYTEVQRDKAAAGLFGFGGSSNIRPRVLMCRQLDVHTSHS